MKNYSLCFKNILIIHFKKLNILPNFSKIKLFKNK